MRIKLLKLICVLSCIFINLNPTFAYIKTVQNVDEKDVTKEYLKKIPTTDYILGPGDSFRVFISRDLPELSSSVTIDGEGTVHLPRLQRVYVDGLTINELTQVLNEAYEEYVRTPSVQIRMLGYRPIRVLIEGEVQSPGSYLLKGAFSVDSVISSNSLDNVASSNTNTNFYFPTVFDVIREGGGITEYSNLSNIRIIRKNNISNGAGKITTSLDFTKTLLNGDNSQNLRVYDSDKIIIQRGEYSNKEIISRAVFSNLNAKYINVNIVGRVNTPGLVKLRSSSVLSDAIDVAGGTKILKGKTTFLRFNKDGTIDKRKFKFRKNAKRGSFNNPTLREGDLIFVGESLLSATNTVISEITAPFVGLFSTYGFYKVLSD